MRKKYLFYFISISCFLSFKFYALPYDVTRNSYQAFMSQQDIVNQDVSNIMISNQSGLPVTVSGLYIASFDINDCSSCFGSIIAGNNVLGTNVSPVFFPANIRVSVGKNYLYNMIYNGIYAIKTLVGSSPCSLPGCSWPGDQSIQGWCLNIRPMSRNSNYTYSNYTNGVSPAANAVPFGHAVTALVFNYNYDLKDPSTIATGGSCLGPIVCDDQSLTCSTSTPQTETFEPY